MAIQLVGNSGVVAEVESNTRGFRVTQRPIDIGSLGAYAIATQTGTIGAGLAADSELFQFRWTDSSRVCLVLKVMASGGSITALDAGFTKMDMVVARSWSAAGTGGGTATLTGNNQNLRTSMGATLVGEIRTATTAALGTGTKSLDSQPIGNAISSVANTAGAVVLPPSVLFDALGGQLHPLALVQNEGFVIRATVPATGTWTGGFTVVWAEVTSY